MSDTPFTDWCFTVPAARDYGWMDIVDQCSYLVFGSEVGGDGHPEDYEHFQCFMQLKKRTRFSTLQRGLLKGIHLEPRKGTPDQARDYCQKDGIFQEWGVFNPDTQGARNDLKAYYEDAKKGVDVVTMYATHTSNMIRYRRSYDDIRSAHLPRTRLPARIHWLYGVPGTGKGTFVGAACHRAAEVPYQKSPTDQWWCGYNGEKIVCIDEITSAVPYNLLLNAGDATPLRLPVKFGHAMFLASTIYITSNLLPDQIYGTEFATRGDALLRRAAFYRVARTDDVGWSTLQRMQLSSTGWEPTDEPILRFRVEPAENPSVAESLCMQV